MLILSIDVGIKNLAFCLFIKPAGSDQFQIEKWDTVNLSQPTEESTCMIMDKTKICGKLAKFEKNITHKTKNICGKIKSNLELAAKNEAIAAITA